MEDAVWLRCNPLRRNQVVLLTGPLAPTVQQGMGYVGAWVRRCTWICIIQGEERARAGACGQSWDMQRLPDELAPATIFVNWRF